MAGVALENARMFLRRWGDQVTRHERDDLAQDAAWLACRHAGEVRDHACFPALVRTISRRLRHRALARAQRRPDGEYEDLELLADTLPMPVCSQCVLVCGESVPQAWLLDELDSAITCLSDLNRRLLFGFYEGFSCAELADRFHLTIDGVKVRLHRSRGRLRLEFEARARTAGYLED